MGVFSAAHIPRFIPRFSRLPRFTAMPSRALLVCLGVLCLCLLIPSLASAKLPSTKPEEFSPVIPDFNNLSADWWTDWPDVTLDEREQWLTEVEKAWKDWSVSLPEEAKLAEQVKTVNLRFNDIRKIWKKRKELKKVSILPDVAFPADPTVLQWAESDAATARGRQRFDGLRLEKAQTDENVTLSLNRFRESVSALREKKTSDPGHLKATLNVFQAQVSHLQVLEEQSMINEQIALWDEELKYADAELTRMLKELKYSADAAKKLSAARTEEKSGLEELVRERSDSQNLIFETSDAAVTMQQQIQMMNYSVEALENRLQLRKQELLLAMNSVLNDAVEQEKLSFSKDLMSNAETVRDNLTRQLNVRQRQIVAWVGEDSKAMRKWWQQFEKVGSGLVRVRDMIDDVRRYEKAQLFVYQRQQGWWRTMGDRLVLQFQQLRTSWRNLANYELFAVSQQPITLKDIAKMILVILAAWACSRILNLILRRMVRKSRTSEQAAYTLWRVLNYCIVLITFVIILAMVGLDTSKLTLIAGALSVGIGFGMQAIFSNFISGIILLVEQPLRVGDLVELESGVFGRIRDINVRSTRITTRDNVDILVPNSEFVTGRVTNHTLEDPVRRIHVTFGVAYGTDPEQVREAAMAAAERVPVTFSNWQRKTEVWLTGFGDSSLDFKLVVWVNSNAVSSLGDLNALYNIELLREFNQRGIEIPFPQRDLHVRSWGEQEPPPREVGSAPDTERVDPREPLPDERRGSAGIEDWPGEGGDTGDGESGGDGGGDGGGSPGH
ncbi:mechanosensitive ion channel domain-containing protein [Microbulbifer hydrolyticus]|uniref:Small-conductance mechanosensitive channel n=2 Tax=Microbulbifer hydrolyticus TaxID=48074 RepID=A0AA89PDV7_9GAMM|nr:mechanosensitive ion channel domain-containing protein [Microbulbifer hydrolyticus]MBB5213045.1 small-conductance mechanosensitive channel [Microbulbifer hydrolyticus]